MKNKQILLTFCIPVYNEEHEIIKNLSIIIEGLNKTVGKNNYEILFVENGSTDNTINKIGELKFKNIRHISINKRSHGNALRNGIVNAKGKFVLLSAIDLPFGFSDLNKMLFLSEKNAIIFGSKNHKDSKVTTTLSRQIASRIFRLIFSILFKINIKDTQGSVFINRASVLPILRNCDSENAFFTAQLAIYSQKFGLKITEIPVVMESKLNRKSKYKIFLDGPKMGLSLIKEFIRISFNTFKKPILVIDLDGTLIDVSERHYYVYKKIIIELGGRNLSKKTYWQLKRSKISLNELMLKSGLSKNTSIRYMEIFKTEIEKTEYLKSDKLFSFTLKTLNKLSNFDLYLCTVRKNKQVLRQIKDLKLDRYFKNILFSDKYTGDKSVLIKNHLKHAPLAIIGDSEDDFIAAKNLNSSIIMVESGIRNLNQIQKLKPNFVITNISKLPELLNNN